jgi:hypothetical protein
MKAYKIVYTYNGHEIDAFQTRGIVDRGTAEKIMERRQKSPVLKDRTLYLKEVEIEHEPLKPMRELDGKKVLNWDYYEPAALDVGDLVEADIVDDIIDCLPPACMRSDCTQLGEAMSSRIDENGRDRATYLTFSRVDKNTWRYCGCCFRGESVERGEIPSYLTA